MIGQICKSVNNFFTKSMEQGQFTISGGALSPVTGSYIPDQYVRLMGPVIASGVYRVVSSEDGQMTLDGLPDGTQETFTGIVYGLAIPPDFLSLVEEIQAYQDKVGKAVGGYVSESLPSGYSYSKGTGKTGGIITWKEQFGDRLNCWNRMFDNPAAEIRENNRKGAL